MQKISIIVPVYNTEKYLEKCLSSIVNQKYKNFEVIIINDGSTDNSQKIIDKYGDNYPNIITAISKSHSGISDCRNLGMLKCTGDYFMFVDSDDYISSDLLPDLSPYIKLSPDLIKYKLSFVENDKEIISDGPIFDVINGEEGFNKLVYNDVLLESPCLYLYKKSFISENHFQFLSSTLHEDFGLVPLIILKAQSIISTDICGYFYTSRNDSITKSNQYSNTLKKAYDLLTHYDNMLAKILEYNLSNTSIANVKAYFSNSIILKTGELKKYDQKKYIKEIKKRNLVKNIKVYNFESFIKKLLLLLNIRFYLYLK